MYRLQTNNIRKITTKQTHYNFILYRYRHNNYRHNNFWPTTTVVTNNVKLSTIGKQLGGKLWLTAGPYWPVMCSDCLVSIWPAWAGEAAAGSHSHLLSTGQSAQNQTFHIKHKTWSTVCPRTYHWDRTVSEESISFAGQETELFPSDPGSGENFL